MTYTYIVNPETGEILFDLVHDLITQNIRAIKLIAKKLNAVLRQKRERIMKTKTLFIDEEVQGEKIVDLNTEQLIKQVVKNIDDDVISVEIKKRHKSDELNECITDPSQS